MADTDVTVTIPDNTDVSVSVPQEVASTAVGPLDVTVTIPDTAITIIDIGSAGGSGASDFLGLSDTPNAYTGQALKVVSVNAGETGLEFTTGGSGVSDGDYGDITVSGSNTVWTIDNDVVTNAKLADMADATVKGRALGAGSGDPTDLTGGQVLAIIEAVTPLVSTAEGNAAYQPLDADLTSWAGVTRAAGFDTFATTPSSANLKSLVTDETGTGGALVFATAPELSSIELGHATDTTLTRASAGVLAVEGVNVLTTATGQPLDSTLTAFAAYNTNGLITQTAADTFTGRTITGTASEVNVSNGDGVAGNPTIGLPDDVIITTSLTLPNTGLHLLDTNATHDLIIKPGSNITADRTLTVTTGDTDIIVDLTAVTDEFVLAYDTGTNTWRGVTPPVAGTPSDIVVADESTDTSCFVAFFTAATGNLGPKTNATFTYNSNTDALSIGTAAAFTAGTIELGAASDTTLSRASAGVLAVEGVNVLTTATGQPLDSTLTALAAYNTNGILAQTAADTFAGRTITGTASEVNVSDGDGVAGNPTIGLPDDVAITTSLTLPNTGLHLLDTNATHDLIIAPGSNLTADRTLTVTTGDTDIILNLTAVTDEFVLAYDTGTNTWRGVTPPAAGTPTVITVADESTDTTCFPLFVTAATGDLGPKTNATLTYNSNTDALSIGTAAAFTCGTIELGAASDTTLSRSSAGVLAVEGVTVSLNSTSATHTAGTIELGAASDTTLSRSAAGVLAVEGVNVIRGSTGATDNTVLRADGAGGSLAQNSTVTLSDTADFTAYDATNDGNPEFRLGAADAEELHIQAVYDTGAQTLSHILFTTDVASATANKGLYRFNVDGTDVLDINDTGITVGTSGVITTGTIELGAASDTTLSRVSAGVVAIEGSNILTEGTAEAFVETAIDTLANLTSIQGLTVTLADAGANAFFGWDDTAGAYENLTAAEAEAIIEPLIDTLANLTSIQGLTVTFADAGFDVLSGWDDSAAAHKNFLLADILTEGAPAAGDFLIAYGAEGDLRKVNWSSLPGVGGGINNVVEDTTPELGGDLETNNNDIKFEQFSADAVDAEAIFQKSRNAAIGSHTIVQNGDDLGSLRFQGSNGTTFDDAALILAEVDGTPGASADMPGRLSFWTTPDASATPVERMRIDALGKVIIGGTATLIPGDSHLEVHAVVADDANLINAINWIDDNTGTSIGIWRARGGAIGSHSVTLGADENIGEYNFHVSDGAQFHHVAGMKAYADLAHGTNDVPTRLSFYTTPDGTTTTTERLRIDSDGRIINGGASVAYCFGEHARLTVESTGGQTVTATRWQASSSGPDLNLAKSRGGSIGTYTIVNDDDEIGSIYFWGADGNSFTRGASIIAIVDGTPADEDIPARLSFQTAGGAEGMRITNDQKVVIGNTDAFASVQEASNNDTASLQMQGTSAANTTFSITRWSDDTNPARISLCKARSGTVGTHGTVPASGNSLGAIIFGASDGTNFEPAAWIGAQADGTITDDVVPGRITMHVNSGGTTTAEKFRLQSDGWCKIGSSGVPATPLEVVNNNAATNTVVQMLRLSVSSSGTPANGLGTGLQFQTETTADNHEIGATIEAVITDVTSTSEDFALDFKTMAAGAAAATRLRLTDTAWLPGTDDAIQIGSTSLRIADIFLAEGGVINWDNGDVTITQTNNNIAFGGEARIISSVGAIPHFWVYWTANSTTILASYNMTSIADTATGDADGTIDIDFSSANWSGQVSTNDTTNGWDGEECQSSGFNARAAGTFGVLCSTITDGTTAACSLTDPDQWNVCGMGVSA